MKKQLTLGLFALLCAPSYIFSQSYAGGSLTTQMSLTADVANPINFPNNVVTPLNIVHPASGSNAKFQVQQAGIYLVSWVVNFQSTATIASVITLDIFNVTTNTSLFNSQEEYETLTYTSHAPRYKEMSGQMLIQLNAFDTIMLRVEPSNGAPRINSGLLNIVQIA